MQEDDQEPAHPHHDIYTGEDSDEQHVTAEDEDTRAPLTSVVRDPHLKELLLKKTTNPRSAAREQYKLAQLEIDLNTPFYPDCKHDDSHLKVALDVPQMKVRYKWSDVSVDASLQYWQSKLPKENTCPKICDEAKKIVCPFDLPHKKYHVCINDSWMYGRRGPCFGTCRTGPSSVRLIA